MGQPHLPDGYGERREHEDDTSHGELRPTRRGHDDRGYEPITPPSSFVITTVAERGRSPSGQRL